MSTEEELQKLKEQIEFYFSDSNFPKDKFLRAQAALNEEGYVAVSVISSFSRIKSITTDIESVKKAIKSSEKLKLNSDETLVKRISALPEEDTSIQRTIYAKGFPAEQGYSIEDVHSVFDKLGKILCVRIRKTAEKKLKPSVFVEFSTPEEAMKVVTTPLKFKDQDLLLLLKSNYLEKKKEEHRKKIQEKKGKRKSEKQPEDSEKKQKKPKEIKEKENKEECKISGAIISFKNIGDNMTRETLKEYFGEFGKVVFVDFSSGNTSGYIRWSDSETAKKAIEQIKSSKKEIGGLVPEVESIQEDEEKAYWNQVQTSRKESNGGRGGRNGRGGRGGRGGRRKRY